jgi:O-methyltransferase involved in polyketide biosynthesis
MDPARDAKIGPTAHYTAYVWKRLRMPNAEHFATPRGALMFWSFRLAGEWVMRALPGLPSMEQYLAMRHRLIEGALDELGPDRIVELGAGLSRRGVTWAGDRGVPYVEIDLPHMARAKRERIARAPAALGARLEGLHAVQEGDILEPAFGERLAEILRGARRPAIIAEGVLGYFGLEERRRILGAARQGLGNAPEGIFLCDLRTGTGELRPAVALLRGAIRVATSGRGAREDYADDATVRAAFHAAGFSGADKLEASRLPDLAHLTIPAAVWRGRPGAAGAD